MLFRNKLGMEPSPSTNLPTMLPYVRARSDTTPEASTFGPLLIPKVLRSAKTTQDEPLSRAAVLKALREAQDAVRIRHCELTKAWGAPISLFGKRHEDQAVARGVPRWAIDKVREVQELLDEVTVLGNHVESYEIQIEEAFSQGRRVTRHGLSFLLQRLESHEHHLQAQLSSLRAARAAFGRPADAPQELPVSSPSVEKRGCDLGIDPKERRIVPVLDDALLTFSEMCNRLSAYHHTTQELCDVWNDLSPCKSKVQTNIIEPTSKEKWRTAVGGMLHSMRVAGKSAVKAAAAATSEQRVAELRAQLDTARSRARRQVGNLMEGVGELGSLNLLSPFGGLSSVVSSPREERSPCAWDEVSGRPSSWLAVDEIAREQRAINSRVSLFSQAASPSFSGSAQSRWERCRRHYDRRWSLS